MDKVALSKVCDVSINILRVHIIKPIDDRDLTFDEIRSQLFNGLEAIKAKLDILLDESLETSKLKIDDAMINLQHGRVEEAYQRFEESKQSAAHAFRLSPSFHGKLHANRIQLFCTLFQCGYFFENNTYDWNTLKHLGSDIYREALAIAEVRSSVRDEFRGAMNNGKESSLPGSNKIRRQVLAEIHQYRLAIADLINTTSLLPMTLDTNIDVNLRILGPSQLVGHNSSVTCMIIADGRLFTGSDDKSIRVWDTSSLLCIGRLTGHDWSVTCLTAAGGRVYSGSYDKTILVWDTNRLQCQGTCVGHTGYVTSLISHQGRLFSASDDTTIRVWELNTAFPCIHICQGHTASVDCFTICNDKCYSGSKDKTIRIWDLITFRSLGVCTGHTSWITCMIYSAVDGRLCTGSDDKTIRVWDISSTSNSTSKSGSYISNSSNNSVSSSNTTTAAAAAGQCVGVFVGHTWLVYCLALADRRLFSGAKDHTVRIWDMVTLQCLGVCTGHTGLISYLIISQGRVYSASEDTTIRVWDATATTTTFECLDVLSGHTNLIRSLAISGGRLYSGSEDKLIHVRYI